MGNKKWEFNPKDVSSDFTGDDFYLFKQDYSIYVYAQKDGTSAFAIQNKNNGIEFDVMNKEEVRILMRFIMDKMIDEEETGDKNPDE